MKSQEGIFSVVIDFLRTLNAGDQDSRDLQILFLFLILVTVALVCFLLGYQAVMRRIEKQKRKKQRLHFLTTLRIINQADLQEFNLTKKQLYDFAKKCERLGIRIDRHTGRYLNSAMVSDLVYEISLLLNQSKKQSILNFLAAMIYDAGFLDIPEYVFSIEISSRDEIQLLKTHVFRSSSYYDFVPAEFKLFFEQTANLHHELINGTGYPEGLTGENIPLTAKIIHVVESYVSLVSRRSYHATVDSKSAIKELKENKNIYDELIVDCLEKVIV